MKEQELDILKKGLCDLSIDLSSGQADQFLKYGTLLQEWNEKMNLTAITDGREIALKHFLDSVSGKRIFPFERGNDHLLDLGTGAGFPGIPLKILFPNLQITLVDSLKKRIGFLTAVIETLGLTGIRAVHARAELLAREAEHREQYDICTSRAVANLATLSEYCLPFVKVGGYFLSYKGPAAEQEMEEAKKAIQILGGKLAKRESFSLPEEDAKRSLILIRKEKATPKKYPRQAGTPAKKPLH